MKKNLKEKIEKIKNSSKTKSIWCTRYSGSGETQVKMGCEQEFEEGLDSEESGIALLLLSMSLDVKILEVGLCSGGFSEQFFEDQKRAVVRNYTNLISSKIQQVD